MDGHFKGRCPNPQLSVDCTLRASSRSLAMRFYGLSMVTMIFGMTNIITDLGLDAAEVLFV